MSKGKYASKRSRSSKSLVLVLALVMLITATVGGTLAWLSAESNTVENTFTSAKLFANPAEEFTLWENKAADADNDGLYELTDAKAEDGKNDYMILPGVNILKNPTITVENLLENAYLYIEVEDSLPERLTYALNACWKSVGADSNVYYYNNGTTSIIPAGTTQQDFNIIEGNTITVPNDYVPAENVTEAYELSFKAYMVQSTGNGDDAIEAWNNTYGNP